MPEKIHAVIFKDNQKGLFTTEKSFRKNAKKKEIKLHRVFKSKVDANIWLQCPEKFPKKKGFYAVKIGRHPGIYATPDKAIAQMKGVSGAEWQSFYTKAAAAAYIGMKVPAEMTQIQSMISGCQNNTCYCKIKPAYPIRIYTDASFKSINKASYAFCIIEYETGSETAIGGKIFNVADISHAELYAVVMALRIIHTDTKVSISIFTDSYYVFHSVCSNSGKGALWNEFYFYAQKFNISVNWIKGHNGDKYNTLCDKIARQMNV